MSLGQMIRKKREQLNLTLNEVSNRVGLSKPYLSTIETGKVKNPPSDQLLKKLEKTLNFEPGLLLHIAHLENLPSDIRYEFESAKAENQKMRQFIKKIVHEKTDPSQFDTLLAETELDADKQTAGRLIPVIKEIPVNFADLDFHSADDYVRCPDLHDPDSFAVYVIDDSMEPKFYEGDIVVFSPAAEVCSGDDCFICLEIPQETTFKRVFFEQDNKVRLQPRNEKYPPKIIDGKQINGLYRAVVKYEKL